MGAHDDAQGSLRWPAWRRQFACEFGAALASPLALERAWRKLEMSTGARQLCDRNWAAPLVCRLGCERTSSLACACSFVRVLARMEAQARMQAREGRLEPRSRPAAASRAPLRRQSGRRETRLRASPVAPDQCLGQRHLLRYFEHTFNELAGRHHPSSTCALLLQLVRLRFGRPPDGRLSTAGADCAPGHTHSSWRRPVRAPSLRVAAAQSDGTGRDWMAGRSG